ncbi:HEAT repeat domain-containing protein [Chloroflexota bacterium]
MTKDADLSFQELIDALLDFDKPFPPRFLYLLSDLEKTDLNKLAAIWDQLPAWRRQGLMEDLAELNERDYLLSYNDLCRFTVKDEDPKVRVSSVKVLEQYDLKTLIPLYLDLLSTDNDEQVRATAAHALGRYVYLGEIDEINTSTLQEIEDKLLQTTMGEEEFQIRQVAFESLGYSSREEVQPLIEEAYNSEKKEWVSSALIAMARSANERWRPQVMEKLDSDFPIIKREAARAAGELEIQEAIPYLLDLLDDPDEDILLASTWALSQIGGEGVRERMEQMYDEADTSEYQDYLELALDNLEFNEEMRLFPLFDLPENENEDLLDDLQINIAGSTDLPD